jgi:hypothetical protein
MYIGTVVAMLSTDPTASADRAVRIKNAAAGFWTDKDMICNDTSIAVNVDCAMNFDGSVAYGRVLLIGKKTSAQTVVPCQRPLSLLEEHGDDMVVACHYYDEVPAEEFEFMKAATKLLPATKKLYRFGSAKWSSLSCTSFVCISCLFSL